jgi:hypothetical protein
MKRSSIDLFVSTDRLYRAVVLQVLQIDLLSLELILLQQRIFLTIPHLIEYDHPDQSLITGIVLAKVYSSSEDTLADLHLLSVYEKIFSIAANFVAPLVVVFKEILINRMTSFVFVPSVCACVCVCV